MKTECPCPVCSPHLYEVLDPNSQQRDPTKIGVTRALAEQLGLVPKSQAEAPKQAEATKATHVFNLEDLKKPISRVSDAQFYAHVDGIVKTLIAALSSEKAACFLLTIPEGAMLVIRHADTENVRSTLKHVAEGIFGRSGHPVSI